MSEKRCPNCGACKECGHAPQPFRFTYPYAYWSVTPPYVTGDFPQYPAGNTVTWTFDNNTGGSYQ